MKNKATDIVKIAFPLFIICTLMVALLAVVNSFTAPVIAQNEKRTVNDSMKTLFGLAETETLIAKEHSPKALGLDQSKIKTVYEISTSEGFCGYCFRIVGKGAYKGSIEMLIALSEQGEVLDLLCIAQSETPGKGDLVLNEAHYESTYIGRNVKTIPELASAKISGSTKTSSALHNALQAALDAYQTINGENGEDGL